jgi:sortase A
MRGTRYGGSNSRGTRLLRYVERVFLMGGVAALAWCAYIVTDAYILQRLARERLESTSRETRFASTSSGTPSTNAASARSRPTTGTPLAELSIPRIGLSAVVLHGTDAHTLRLGLGHIDNTPLPGEAGNVAIAGHRDSFFRPLRNVQVGDDILLETPEERVHYRVSAFRVVNSHDVAVVGPTREDALTLVTCYPFWFIGEAPDRFVVRATRIGDSGVAYRSAALQTSEPDRQSVFDTTPPGNRDAADNGATQSHKGREGDLAASRRVSRSIQSTSIALSARGANDDDALVRKAIDRFRLAYNAPLARHREAVPDRLMTFRFCEIAIAGSTATATCNGAPASPQSDSSPIWTVGLRRISDEWTITSVAMN